MTTSEFIAQRRRELGLTLDEVGKACGVGKSTVKKWEDGFISNMKRDKIAALAKVLQVNPLQLIGDASEETQKKSAPELSEADREILDLFNQLKTDDKEMVLKIIRNSLK
ncbi:MAG: helix-turn-helix domain-containing protein [Oscillospiraceae bacterium]|nr:helix-turn-helix domain-containing protein [Oscillospiraceae bacterium]